MAKQHPPEYYRRYAWLWVGLSVLFLAAGFLRLNSHRGFPYEFGMAVGWASIALMYFGNTGRRRRGLRGYHFTNVWTDLGSPLPERRRDAFGYAALTAVGFVAALGAGIVFFVTGV
jgi:hypothetical protein